MFYQCPKCKGVWEYPVEKCPECFLKLERLKSEKLRVIGISKVTIPSVFHPRVPYFVLLLEDGNGNRWVQKSIKEYKIGDEFKIECSSPGDEQGRGAVAIWRVKYDFLEAIEKVINLVAGLKINSETKILLLPALVSASHSYFRDNTSPEFLEAILKILFEIGIKPENIKVCAQSFDEIEIGAKAQKSGLLEVCQKNKVLPFDLAKGNFVKKAPHQNLGEGLEISEEVFKTDFILNLPILKIEKASASENVLKFLKKENYLGLKYLYSDEEIMENLNKVLPSYLTIADGQLVQKSNKFTAFLGLTLASFNPLNLDRVFAEITMIRDLPESLKKVKIEEIPIVGRKVEELQYNIEKI